MPTSSKSKFDQQYQQHLQHLKLKGLRPKTIDAYSRAIRYIGGSFDYKIDNLSEQQLTDYLCHRLTTHSWSAVKLDLYGLKFFYQYVLNKPWQHVDLIKPPRAKRLPDILTVQVSGKGSSIISSLHPQILMLDSYRPWHGRRLSKRNEQSI